MCRASHRTSGKCHISNCSRLRDVAANLHYCRNSSDDPSPCQRWFIPPYASTNNATVVLV